jgi:hypothetical protein
LANLKFKSRKIVSNEFLTFKKLESPNRNIFISRSPSPETTILNNEESRFIGNKEFTRNSPVNLTDTLLTPSIIETPIPLKSTNFSQW